MVHSNGGGVGVVGLAMLTKHTHLDNITAVHFTLESPLLIGQRAVVIDVHVLVPSADPVRLYEW